MDEEKLDNLDSQNERTETEYPWVLFSINGTVYGMNSKYVLSIEILDKVTPIVDSPSYCPGITEFRKDMISLVDLRSLFGLGSYTSAYAHSGGSEHQTETDFQSMTVVIEVDGRVKGIIVDKIISVEYITRFIDSMTADGSAAQSRYLRQVAKREKLDSTVLILNEKLLGEL